MLVLFETSAGYGLFRVKDEKKLALAAEDPSIDPTKLLSLQSFHQFKDLSDAMQETTALFDGSAGDQLVTFLRENVIQKGLKEKLLVSDKTLASVLHKLLKVDCEAQTDHATEAMRAIRSALPSLVPQLAETNINQLNLALAHSLSRYKLKFSPDKVDTMVVQAVSLLDDLDKELNTYAMRAREWYGWHFPEMARVVNDNEAFCKVVLAMGDRTRALSTDFTGILEEGTIDELREVAQVSMGTEISEEDLDNIRQLCEQVVSIAQYRRQLAEYLRARMMAIAPNLTALVGELVGARLVSHCGSLLALAKNPGSTIQILGAEKALFRAMKTRHETPKYGLLFHASLVGQASAKSKGKIARVLAAKCALAVRCDALGDEQTPEVGEKAREAVEKRLRWLEGRSNTSAAKLGGSDRKKPFQKHERNPDVQFVAEQQRAGNDDVAVNPLKRERDEEAQPQKEQQKQVDESEAKRLKKEKKKAEKAEKKAKKAEKKEKKKKEKK